MIEDGFIFVCHKNRCSIYCHASNFCTKVAEIVAKFGTFISLLHCGHTNLYELAVFVIDTLYD